MGSTLIAEQILRQQDKDGMLRRALERIIQLYTDKSHFVYELLQNAEDAKAARIKFLQYEDRLVVLHDGHPFSMDNLTGLCDIGKSDKTDDLNQIGEFGVGFKSVFGICETVRLYSHPKKADRKNEFKKFAVEIRDFTHPVDIDDKQVPDKYTTMFEFPYSVDNAFSGFQTTEELNRVLSERLQNLGITTLLFMKNLQSIEYEINLSDLKAAGEYLLDKETISDHCSLVSATGKTKGRKELEDISYLVFSRPIKGIRAGKTIDIAFAVNVKETGEYSFVPARSPYISVYFPTETESKLKFIVQGPYRTTPNRSSVPADDKDNIELAKQTAELLRESVIELRDSGKLNFSFLNILPVEYDAFESAPLFKCMFSATKEMLEEEELLPCKDGTYASASCVKIARGADFADILSDDLLTELLDDEISYHWLPTFLTETNKTYKTLYDFLIDVLDIEVIRPENLRNAFNSNPAFLPRRDDEWLIKLYNMYASVAAAFSKQRGGQNMLTAEFVKTSKGNFVAPYRKSDDSTQNSFFYHGDKNASYLPNVFLPVNNMEGMGDISFVDEYILERCRPFFTETLNLQRPNEYEFFINDFKKRYESGDFVSDDQHFKDLRQLLYYLDYPEYKDEVKGLIKKYLKIRCIRDGGKICVNPYEEKIYFPVNSEGMSIEKYFSHIADFPYVDMEFYKTEDIDETQLKKLSISEEIATGLDILGGEYPTGKPGRQPEWQSSYGFRWKLNLLHLNDVLEYISSHPDAPDSMAKSSFIFRFLQNHEEMLSGDVNIGGSTPNKCNEHSDIVTRLRLDDPHGSKWNGKWLYTESGELAAQREISKHDLDIRLYGEIKPASKLYEILGFKKNEEDHQEEAVRKYDCLDNETKNRYFEIELQRRYGLSIMDMDEKFGSEENSYVSILSHEEFPDFEFPSASVKNWDSLRKHVAEVLVFASPVKYEYKVRRIRASRPDKEIAAYLRGMYHVSGVNKYACQMCHEPFSQIEKCQLMADMEDELDAMYLCMCPNCAAEYRRMRTDEYELQNFLDRISEMEEREISSQDPVKVDFGNESIWFTQTHIAEIRELMILQEEADQFKEQPEKSSSSIKHSQSIEQEISLNLSNEAQSETESVKAGTDVYKEYVGKKVLHKSGGCGTVIECDGTYITIHFDAGKNAGETKQYSLEMCLEKGWIKLM